MKQIASVALHLDVKKTLDYEIPAEFSGKIEIGSLVEVPLNKGLQQGTVLHMKQAHSPYPLKPIQRVLSDTALLIPPLQKLATWISSYYCTSLSSVIKTLVPATVRGKVEPKKQFVITRNKTKEEIVEALIAIRKRSYLQAEVLDFLLKVEGGAFLSEVLEKTTASKAVVDALVKKGFLNLEKIAVDRSPLKDVEYFPSKPKNLTGEQKEALEKIEKSLLEKRYETHLLFGITGSGKTEIYLQAISKALSLGKEAIMLVPEISLTAQTIERFQSRFKNQIAILHHQLSDGERHDEWKRIQRGEAKIVIGARSAIFCPLPNLGLIIVDEEHESSYKQSDGMPAYHARDVAVVRGRDEKATVILGSATPSIESYYNAMSGKYTLSKLKARPDSSNLAQVELIDMKKEYEKKKGITVFSEALLSEIEKRYKTGEQTILFLNRRGYHSLLLCKGCGNSVKCTACDVSMTFHKGENCLACHLCGHTLNPPPKICPTCKADEPLKFRGVGTEQVEAALYAIFNEIRVIRLDRDTTKHKGSHQKLYKSFRTGKADVLIGTQMIAKGLHFPEVTLVGVLNSDMGLNIPDFRAGETTFQLLTQVAGRAGRGLTPGKVIIQTAIPENSVIVHAQNQDFEKFYEEEIEIRKLFQYPPFAHLAKVRFSGPDPTKTREAAENFRLALLQKLSEKEEVSIVSPPLHAKIKAEYRFQFIAKSEKAAPLIKALTFVKEAFRLPSQVRLFIDVNPSSTCF